MKHVFILSSPILLAIFVRTFFIDFYYVPSGSMERTLSPEDYVVVNKISYGVKLPLHVRDVPVIGSFFEAPKNKYKLFRALKSFDSLEREDIVVFKSVEDKNKYLVKRIIGLPRDSIHIQDSRVMINSKKLEENEHITHGYFKQMPAGNRLYQYYSNKEFDLLSEENKKGWQRNMSVKNVNFSIFPVSKQYTWNRDNYGPVLIPKKGPTIRLTKENFDLYKKIIIRFEGARISLNDEEPKIYTFKRNYLDEYLNIYLYGAVFYSRFCYCLEFLDFIEAI